NFPMARSPAQILEDDIARLQTARQTGKLQFEDDEKVDLKNYTFPELQRLLVEGYGQKAFRAQQIYEWLYRHIVASFDEMTNISKSFRATLQATARVAPIRNIGTHGSSDGTAKLQF